MQVFIRAWSSNNSRNGQLTSYKIAKDFLSEPIYTLTDVELPGSEESNISANLNKIPISTIEQISLGIKRVKRIQKTQIEWTC